MQCATHPTTYKKNLLLSDRKTRSASATDVGVVLAALAADGVAFAKVGGTGGRAGALLRQVEDLPKLEVLVAACCRYGRTIWRQARMQYASLVRLADVDDFRQGRERPDGELVVGEAVRGQDLARMRVEDE